MGTKQTRENLQETFLVGLSGIFAISEFRKKVLKEPLTIIACVSAPVVVIICFVFKLDELKFLLEIKNILINFLPGILGFTIAGYSLMVGFIQSNILDKITEPREDSKFSLYQKMSATFAVNVVLQALALVFAYFIHFVNYIDINMGRYIGIDSQFLSVINYIGLCLTFFWFAISLLMVIQIVLNIFGFSQLHHYFINKFKIEEEEKEK